MKTCPNCRCVYGDDYRGTCLDCGAPMGNVNGNTQGDLAFKFARQAAESNRETALESSMKRGNYDGVKVSDGLMSVARGFVVVDHEKLARIEAENAEG